MNKKAIDYLTQLIEEESTQEERDEWVKIKKEIKNNRFNLGEGRVMSKNELFVRCDCHAPEHQMIITRNREDKEYYVQTHLITYENVFKRILAAVKYIFGYRSRYGEWDSIILSQERAKELASFLEEEF